MRSWLLATATVSLLLLGSSPVFGQAVIIDEGLIGGAAKPESNLVMIGTTIITEPVPGSGDFVLQLTDAVNSQSGAAWFDVPFDLRAARVVFNVDMFIWAGSRPPADGISAIFQFYEGATSGERTTRIGGGGGGLGTSNFPSPYVSVAWDTWDNEEFMPAVDPENSIWDAAAFAGGGTHSAHIEVNQNLNPGSEFSNATNISSTGLDVPYMIDDAAHDPGRGPNDPISITAAVGDLWGPEEITLPVSRWTVTFESGFITCSLEEIVEIGGEVFPPILYDPNPGPNFELPWNNRSEFDRTVLITALDDFPADANAILGFAASTGGAREKHEVDNIKITTFPNPREVVVLRVGGEAPRDKGAINAGGDEVGPVMVDGVEQTFLADRAVGPFGPITNTIDTTTDPTQIILTIDQANLRFGYTDGNNASSTPNAQANLPDPALEAVYQSEREDGGGVSYEALVVPGRYNVRLHFSETCIPCVDDPGENRRFSARLEGETVLSFFSPFDSAQEAGDADGLNFALSFAFEVDVADDGNGSGLLNIDLIDLGTGNPPGNAMIKGISFHRLGDATGAAITGDFVDNTPGPGEPLPISIRIAANEDDTEEHLDDNRIDATSSDLELGEEGGGDFQIVGMRFVNVEVPQGVRIVSASIQFTSDDDDTDINITDLDISGELSPNAAPLTTTAGDLSNRALTVNFTQWNNVPPWDTEGVTGPDQLTPDIGAVIQEIVLQADWASGNAILILIEGNGERTAESHNGDSALAPVLNITYIVPRPPTVVVPPFVEVADGLFHFEAEDFDDRVSNDGEHDWTLVPDEDSGGGYPAGSGGAHLESLPDSGTNNNPAGDVFTTGPVVSYRFRITTPGDYRIWASVAQLDGSSDSFYLRIAETFGAGGNVGDWWRFNPGPPSDFNWTGVGGLGNQNGGGVDNAEPMIETLSAGTYTLEIAMREDGSAVDEIIIDGTGTFNGSAAAAAAIGFSERKLSGFFVELWDQNPIGRDSGPRLKAFADGNPAPFNEFNEVIDYLDTGGDHARTPESNFFPGLPEPGDNNDFIMRAQGIIEIPSLDPITFGLINDDSVLIEIDGRVVYSSNVWDSGNQVTAPPWTPSRTGPQPILILFEEGGGGAYLEITQLVDGGDFVLLNDPNDTRSYRVFAPEMEPPPADPPALVGDNTAISVLGCGLTDASFETNEDVTIDGATASLASGAAAPGVTVTPGSLNVSLDAALPFYDTLQVDVDVTGVSSGLSTTLTVFMVHRPLDINGDGRTNISDATAFGAEFNGAQDPNLIDVNCDGVVNIRDATEFGAVWNGGAANSGPE